MRKFLSTLLSAFLAVTLIAACDSFVEEVDLPIDSIDDIQLNDETQVPFLISGIQTRFATTHDNFVLLSEGLSDAFVFDRDVPNATFDTYAQIERADIDFANNSVDGVYNRNGELRFFADNFLERIAKLEFSDAALQREAQFTGNFYGGVARYFYATYIGLEPRRGGGVISESQENPGSFIEADQMYSLALDKLNAALGSADDIQRRATNSVIARLHLYRGNFGEARAAAQQGMQEGDAAFASLHSVESTNAWYFGGGPGRHQWVADCRFADVLAASPEEIARIPLAAIVGNSGGGACASGTLWFRQDKFNLRESPLPLITWQENELMLAELDLRDGQAGSALTRINRVRASHGVSAVAEATMAVLIAERDLELFATGQRLIDQRRFGLWHLPETLQDGTQTWQYLPITQSERNSNPNLNN